MKTDQIEQPLTAESPLNEISTVVDAEAKVGEDHKKLDDKNSKSDNSAENYRLAGRPPLKTLVFLAVGPLISQLVSSLYGVVASMWVAKAVGDIGMASVSLFTNLDNIGRAFGYFMNCAASQKISALFGQQKGEEVGQVICDLFRCCIISGAFVPCALLPIAKPLGRWFGADDETLGMGFNYLSILLGCSVFSCFFLMFCGCLQAEGRTTLVSVVQISSFVMNMAVFCPLFLLGLKMGTKGAALATVCSEAIPTIFLFVFYFRGKFGCKPKISGLIKKFSPHTWPALGVGVSQLAALCSRSLPSILQRKFMGMITQHENVSGMTFNDAMAGFNAVIRICGITDSFRLAISMALLPTASYAYSAELYGRFLRLSLHGCWLNIVWGILTCIITCLVPKYVAMMISSSKPFLNAAAPMLRNANIEAPFAWGRYICQTILQALSFGGLATVYSVVSSFILNIGIYCLLYYTNKYDVPRMMYAYAISSSIAFFIGIICLIKPLKMVYSKAKEAQRNIQGILSEDDGNKINNSGNIIDKIDSNTENEENFENEKKNDCKGNKFVDIDFKNNNKENLSDDLIDEKEGQIEEI